MIKTYIKFIILLLALGITKAGLSQVKFINLSINQSNIEDCVSGFNNANIKVFPNPTNGVFIVEVDKTEVKELRIELTNTNGLLLYCKEIYSLDDRVFKSIDLSEYSPGIYFLKLISINKKYTVKIILM